MDLRPGECVGRYTLVEPLGEGAQGRVWKVVDPVHGVVRALKLFDLTRLPPTAPARAKVEVEAASKAADHPAIVPCHDVLSLQGQLGLVFEHVRGVSLDALFGDLRMSQDHRHAVLDQLASALAHVHARGVAHRDLKPENVLVTDAFWNNPRAPGSVKLVDFGIAAFLASPIGLTAVGGFVGTVPYLPPEVLLPSQWPIPPGGAARDVFAFGVLAWELIVGGHPTGLPLDAPPEAYAAAYRDADQGRRPWPPRGPTGELAGVIAACLSLDPARRPPDGSAVERLLLSAKEAHRAGHDRGSPSMAPGRAGVTKPHEPPTDEQEVPSLEVSRPPSLMAPPTPVATQAGYPYGATVTMTGGQGAGGAGVPRAPTWSGSIPAASSSAPLVTPFPGPPAPRRRSASIPWLVTAALCVIFLGGAIVHIVTRDRDESLPAPPPPEAPVPRQALPTPARQPTASVMPCCTDGRACKSRHACAPRPCSATRMPERSWRLRLSGAARGAEPSFPEDLARTYPYGRVCVRRAEPGEPWTCALLTKMAASNDGDGDDRPRVMTSDLERGVEIRIEDRGTELAAGFSAPNPNGLATSALCSGLRLLVGPRETATYLIRGYLDED